MSAGRSTCCTHSPTSDELDAAALVARRISVCLPRFQGTLLGKPMPRAHRRARTGGRMNVHKFLAVLLLALALAIPRSSESQSKDQLGKVDFANSCSPAVQASFQRSVAMLHSFWYTEAEKSFREVLVQDPS